MRRYIIRTAGANALATPAGDSDSEMRDANMDGGSTESSGAPANFLHPVQKDGAALVGSETWADAEQMGIAVGGSGVSGETGADVCRQDIAAADEQGIVAMRIGVDDIGSADIQRGDGVANMIGRYIGSADKSDGNAVAYTPGGDGSVGQNIGGDNAESGIGNQSANAASGNDSGEADSNGAAGNVADSDGDATMGDPIGIHGHVTSSVRSSQSPDA